MDHFLPFNNLKKQNFEKMKKSQEISLCTSVPKNMIICYTVPEIQRVTDVIFIFHFGLFFVLYPSNNPKNQNLKKKKKRKKTPGDIIVLHMCTKKYDHMMYVSWDMVRDRQTEGKKWHIEVGAPPNNKGSCSYLSYNQIFVWKTCFRVMRW